MKRRIPPVIILLTILSLFVFVSPAAAVDLTSNGFRITGAGVPIAVLTKYGDAYGRTFPECRFVVFEDNATEGFERFVEGRTDLLVSTQAISDTEKAAAVKNGIVSQQKALGNICVAVITNAGNPVQVLTVEQLKEIFSGRITNWKQVGGSDEPIQVVVAEDEGLGVGAVFRRTLMKEAPYAGGCQRVASAARSVVICSKSPNAIGYILAVGPEFVRLPEARVKFVGLSRGSDSPVYFPYPGLVGKSSYPLVTPLYFAWTRGTVNPCVRSFASFFEEVCESPNRTALINK
jgi:phosphate transport system substrate-binding protein